MEKQLLKRLSSLERKVVDLYHKVIKPTPKYKVFTVLLSQEGTPDIQTISEASLVIGRTYQIDDNGNYTVDFTNVGAPNNNVGTFFIATGDTPNSWGNEGVLTFDSGAPVVKILEDTINTLWLTYAEVGAYSIESDELFERRKTWYNTTPADITGPTLVSVTRKNDYAIIINSSSEGSLADGILDNIPVEIRIYN